MEKRVFLAIFLSFIVLAIYQAVFPPPSPPASPTAPATVAPATSDPAAPASAAALPEASAPAETGLAGDARPETVVGDSGARDVVVETDSVRAVFSTRGAVLTSWQLKDYLQDGTPLDLVPRDLDAAYPRAFTMATDDADLSMRLASALFRPSMDRLSLGQDPGQLTFEFRDESGVSARKTFHFQPDRRAYVLRVEAAVDLNGSSRPVMLTMGPGIGLGYQPDGSRATPVRAIHYLGDDLDRLDADDIPEQPQFQGEFRFAGVEDQYFLSAALPGTEQVAVEYQPVTAPVPGSTDGSTRTFVDYRVSVPGSLAMAFFLGPKDFDILRSVDPRLELVRAIDFGIFRPVVTPLLQALKWINGFLGNYGWSIVALTILINLAIFPLRHRSMVSMRKMQALQPQVKAIQARYAKYKVTDPERQKMNQEMMALYKQKGVNPASGCVPMLLTMPILFAFYSLLSAAIELRGAPFVGWITDLSRHDPLYVTPVMMGASMFLQQRMMPTTADPIQQKLFLLMPVIFTASFLWAPAGLVLYWFSSNLMAIGQQYVTNQVIGPPPVPVKPAAKATKAEKPAKPAKTPKGRK
jgi:YidC/Oxa1 family membrane protein insertase